MAKAAGKYIDLSVGGIVSVMVAAYSAKSQPRT
jgi:hypothetical protein